MQGREVNIVVYYIILGECRILRFRESSSIHWIVCHVWSGPTEPCVLPKQLFSLDFRVHTLTDKDCLMLTSDFFL